MIKTIRIAICDDEPFMLEDITAWISRYMEAKNLVCEINGFPNGNMLLKHGKAFDILFLDIQMDGPDGVETARRLREQSYHGLLIFITVLKERVFDAFEVQAFDYLMKPLDDSRFQRTMERALKFLEQENKKNIIIQKGTACQIIPISQIVYCEVFGRKIYLHRQDGEILDYYDKLEALEKRMDRRFFRCHRSYLVNLDYVCGYGKEGVLLSSGGNIPLSRLREQELTHALLIHMKERRSINGLV